MRRKLLGILLTLCFVIPITATYVILQVQKKQVKRELKRKLIAEIDRKELILFKFTETEKKSLLNWEHSKEFEYKGEMYDVVETNIMGDTTYYHVWWDNEETELNKRINKLISTALDNDTDNEEPQEQLYRFFKTLYYSKSKKNELPIWVETKDRYYLSRVFDHSALRPPPQTPPPEKLKNIA